MRGRPRLTPHWVCLVAYDYPRTNSTLNPERYYFPPYEVAAHVKPTRKSATFWFTETVSPPSRVRSKVANIEQMSPLCTTFDIQGRHIPALCDLRGEYTVL